MSAAHMSARLNRFFRTAVLTGVEASVRLHVERGDPLDAVDESGMTPLMLAAARNYANVCEILLEAGADATLRDPSGKQALDHAVAAKAGGAEAVLQRAMRICPAEALEYDPQSGACRPTTDFVETNTTPMLRSAEMTSTHGVGNVARDDHPQSGTLNASVAPLGAAAVPWGDVDEALPLLDEAWEVEADEEAPPQNEELVAKAVAGQSAMVAHEVVDGAEDWADVEVFLPDRIRAIRVTRDPETERSERNLFLAVLREGCIAGKAVSDVCWLDDETQDLERAGQLTRVIHDLGGVVDEDWLAQEWQPAARDWSSDESAEEADLLSQAQVRLADLLEHRSDPLRFYQRDLSRARLIGADDEARLGQAMEAALGLAQEALAAWPEGLSAVVIAGEQVLAGDRPDSSVFAHADEEFLAPDLPDLAETIIDEGTASDPADAESLDANEHQGDSSEGLRARVEALRRMLASLLEGGAPIGDAGATLRRAALSRSFLLELRDIARNPDSGPGMSFDQAMSSYLGARTEMMQANLRLVYATARRYVYSGEPIDDLLQEGNIGLMKAAEKFDWRRGFKFSTYATWWIRQQIGRYVADSSRLIRVPAHVHQELQKVQRTFDLAEARSGRQPAASEIAAALEMPTQRVSALLKLMPNPASLDDVDVDATIQTATRPRDDDPANAAYSCEVADVVGKLMIDLKPKEKEVITLRFGFGEQDERTLEEVGRILGVTRERIRQIEAKALKRLRQPMRVEKLARDLGLEVVPERHSAKPISSTVEEDADDVTLDNAELPCRPMNAEVRLTNALIAEAFELGIPVEDDRSGPSRQLWIRLRAVPDQTTIAYIAKLRSAGFHFEPGEGYLR